MSTVSCSSGLGAAATNGDHTVVVTGDVGLYHDMNGLLAMKRNGVRATVVVINNGGGSIFDFLPIARHRDGFEELFGTPTGLDLERVAALYELDFTRIAAYDELGLGAGRTGAGRDPDRPLAQRDVASRAVRSGLEGRRLEGPLRSRSGRPAAPRA